MLGSILESTTQPFVNYTKTPAPLRVARVPEFFVQYSMVVKSGL